MNGAPLCDHPEFEARVIVARIEDVGRFSAEVQVRCVKCGTRFRWLGLEMGLNPRMPTTDVSGFELRAPIAPDGHMTSLMAGDAPFPEMRP